MAVSRRGILIGALAGGGLALGYVLRPRHFPLPLQPGKDEFAFDAWIKIGKDGVISVAVPQVEMGQGVTTLIPQVVAHELGADWRQVAVEPAPVSAIYANLALAAHWAPLWLPLAPWLGDDPDGMVTRRWAQDHRFNATADGMTLAAYEAPARVAAASARAMLMQAAAARWNVAWEECDARAGFVVHADKRLPFGALAEEAAAPRAAGQCRFAVLDKGRSREGHERLPARREGRRLGRGCRARLVDRRHRAHPHGAALQGQRSGGEHRCRQGDGRGDAGRNAAPHPRGGRHGRRRGRAAAATAL
jgi:hypothetical protein